MRWPFVSRAEHERQCGSALDAQAAALKAEANERMGYERMRYDVLHQDTGRIIDALNARYDKLLNKYHALRVSGANATPERPVAQSAPELPISVQTAIEEFADGSAAVKRHLNERAWLHINAGKEEQWICQRIREGDSA